MKGTAELADSRGCRDSRDDMESRDNGDSRDDVDKLMVGTTEMREEAETKMKRKAVMTDIRDSRDERQQG